MRREVRRYGDRGLLVELAEQGDVLALYHELVEHPVDGQLDVVPADRCLLVLYADAAAAAGGPAELAELRPDIRHGAPPDQLEVETVYDGADLDEVATLTRLSPAEVVARHTGQWWTVAFTGFAPGFGYLVSDRRDLSVPRRAAPRTQVPAGSVALAAGYSAIYPRSSPGGWQLIGRSAVALWDVHARPPAVLRPGTGVRFRQVDALPAAPSADPPPPGPAPSTGLRVDRAGALALIQDGGRPGYAAYGVPESGAADRAAYDRANAAVGNDAGDAVLELVLGGVAVTAVGDQQVAVTGAATELLLRRASGPTAAVEPGTPVLLHHDDQLRVGPVRHGLRSYLAVRGGLAVAAVLGSRSTDRLAGLGAPAVRAGDVLPVGGAGRRDDRSGVETPSAPSVPVAERSALPVTRGPHEHWLEPGSLDLLCSQQWHVSPQSDRIGLRLTGSPLHHGAATELPSAPLVAGAVQVPPAGEPVVFLRDHPTTGGYPVLAVLSERAVDAAAQLRPGQPVRFELT